MMPVAGQDAVLDAAAIEREAHMRAAIVERENASVVVHQQDRTMTPAHDEAPLGFQLREAGRMHKIRGRRVHVGTMRWALDGSPSTIACFWRGLRATTDTTVWRAVESSSHLRGTQNFQSLPWQAGSTRNLACKTVTILRNFCGAPGRTRPARP